ncbi:MAG TPA: sulfite exporter TauE/SafE family protein [Casimicrobiaceae bacterium]|nr:sulfite exporter TauE/SafE family protein [Casimicrobiaceae bacterium]
MVSWSLIASAALLSTLGGAHCTAMCGGFVAAISARERPAYAPLLPAHSIAARQALYHAGRLTTYATLGAIAGAGGGVALHAADASLVQRPLYLVANVLLLLVALAVARATSGALGWQRWGARAFAKILPALQPLLRGRGPLHRMVLGLAWGLVPCAMVYSALPLALFAGGPLQGAAVMFAFGVGTLPWLTATGFLFDRFSQKLNRPTFRYAFASVIAAFAVAGMYRALLAPHILGAGPFCLP